MSTLNIRFIRVYLAFVSALLLVASLEQAWAQGSTAAVAGKVNDTSGAAIPGASVEAKNTGTGAVRRTVTDEQGRFRVVDLLIGEYEVQASHPGFQTILRKGILLTVGSDPVVDFSLPVGQAQETVTVQGEVSQIETQSVSLGALVESTQMRELPLNGRSYTQLMALNPGVTQITEGAPGSAGGFAGQGTRYSISGSRPNGQAWILDGQDLLGYFRKVPGSGATGNALGVEAIAEFQLLTNTYSAQFGGNGSVVNASSRSGANDFHGSIYEFIRNDALEARNFFDGDKPPAFRRNQYGASAGGPIRKDKLFFFGNWEGFRSRQTVTRLFSVPDDCSRQVLQSTTTPGVCGPPIPSVDFIGRPTPYSTDPATRQRILDTLALWPRAFNRIGGGIGQALVPAGTNIDEDYFLGRMDYNASAKDAVFFRYVYDRGARDDRSSTDTAFRYFWPVLSKTRAHYFLTEWQRVISPTVINHARAGFTRPYEDAFQTGSPVVSNGVASLSAIGSPGVHPTQFFPSEPNRMDGSINVIGLQQLNNAVSLPYYFAPNTFHFGDDVFWSAGAHSLKAGGSVVRQRQNTWSPIFVGSMWVFPNVTSFLQGVAVASVGEPARAVDPQSDPHRDYRYWVYNFYFEDQWKLTSKLSVNLGLRYAPTSVVKHARRDLYVLKNPYADGELWVPTRQSTAVNPSLRNWDPRIGIAWDPFADHKTSIRAGAGVFHDVAHTHVLISWLQPPYLVAAQNFPSVRYPTPFTDLPPNPNPLKPYIPTNGTLSAQGTAQYYGMQSTPYQYQWNLSIQREVMTNTVATVAYSGAAGIHLWAQRDFNSPRPCVKSPSEVAGWVPYLLQSTTGCFYNGAPTFSNAQGAPNQRVNTLYSQLPMVDALGHSTYHAGQASLNRRFSRGLQTQLSYTFSKSIDNNSGAYPFDGSNSVTLDSFNASAERGLSNFSRKHNFRLSWLYQFPSAFRGPAGALLNGWEFTGIYSYLSGYPEDILSPQGRQYATSGIGNIGAARPNVVAGCDPNAGAKTIARWFNPNCFQIAPLGTQGNSGRNSIIGPNLWSMDNSLNKDFRVPQISEQFKIQFRAEFFNSLNHPTFRNPFATLYVNCTNATCPADPRAGRLLATNSQPRQVQFGLKFLF